MWGSSDKGPGELSGVCALAMIASERELVVSDHCNHRIQANRCSLFVLLLKFCSDIRLQRQVSAPIWLKRKKKRTIRKSRWRNRGPRRRHSRGRWFSRANLQIRRHVNHGLWQARQRTWPVHRADRCGCRRARPSAGAGRPQSACVRILHSLGTLNLICIEIARNANKHSIRSRRR